MKNEDDGRLTAVEIASLEWTRNEAEWNETCRRIKAVRRGLYPDDWSDRMLASGAMRRIEAGWKTK